jgi:hypothetical protein
VVGVNETLIGKQRRSAVDCRSVTFRDATLNSHDCYCYVSARQTSERRWAMAELKQPNA